MSCVPQSACGQGSSLISPKPGPLTHSFSAQLPRPHSRRLLDSSFLKPSPSPPAGPLLPPSDCVPSRPSSPPPPGRPPVFLTQTLVPCSHRAAHSQLEGPFQCRSQWHPPGAPPLLKASPLPLSSPSRYGVAHFMFHPLRGVGLLTPILFSSWGLSLAVSSACTLFPDLCMALVSHHSGCPQEGPSLVTPQSPVLLTLHGDRGPLPMLSGNPLLAVCLALSWGPHPWGSGVWPEGRLCLVLGALDGNRGWRGRTPASPGRRHGQPDGRQDSVLSLSGGWGAV